MQVAPWVEKMDDRFGHLCVPYVTRYLVLLQIATYVLNLMSPGFSETLLLDGIGLRNGEVWRILTFMCVPAVDGGPIWFIMYLWFTWFVGDALEREWGAAKVNIYYLTGIISLTVVALFFSAGPVRNDLLMVSMILPFGTVFPLEKIMLYFILPVEARYIAMFYGGFMALAFSLGFMDRAVIFASVLAYLLFFGPTFFADWKLKKETQERRRRFEGK